MATWLLKTEPSAYSWDDLAREKNATWNGVRNAAALINLRAMKKGDSVLIYHTGDERAIVGTATVTKAAYPDPEGEDPRYVVIDLKANQRFARPIPLTEIRSDKVFEGWDLLRIGRLSVVSVPAPMWKRVEQLSKAGKD